MTTQVTKQRKNYTFRDAFLDVFDLFGQVDSERPHRPPVTTSEALAQDWKMVGHDLRKGLDRVAKESHQLKPGHGAKS